MKLVNIIPVVLILLATTITPAVSVEVTGQLVMMPTISVPKYYTDAGELHLNETKLYFMPGGEKGIPQMFGDENRSVMGLVLSIPIDREEITYSRVDGKTVMNGGRSLAPVAFEKIDHSGMDALTVTSESLTIYVGKESCKSFKVSEDIPGAYNIPTLQLLDGDEPISGFVITWLSNPDTINYAFVMPQYVDYVLEQFVLCPPLTTRFQG